MTNDYIKGKHKCVYRSRNEAIIVDLLRLLMHCTTLDDAKKRSREMLKVLQAKIPEE